MNDEQQAKAVARKIANRRPFPDGAWKGHTAASRAAAFQGMQAGGRMAFGTGKPK